MDPGLYAAACAGKIVEIMKFKEKILDQVTEGNHQTVLHLAALSNNSECVGVILEEFPSLFDKVNSRNETALHLAASKGYNAVVQALLDKFPSLLDKVNSRNETALHLAAGEGYTDVVKVLLNKAIHGSDEISRSRFDFIRRGNVDSDTALHLAVRNNHDDVVRLIVKADPSDEHSQNLKSETPLYLAIIGGSILITLTILVSCRNARVDGPEGKTALHAVVISRSYEFIIEILGLRPEILERGDNKGWTAFHYAASLNSVDALDWIIDFIMQRGDRDSDFIDYYALVAVMGKTSDDSKKTAHHIAAYEGHIYILTKLLEYCPEACYVVDEDGRNILHIAAEQNHKDLILSILLDFPDVVYRLVYMQDKKGNTPLHLLVMAGCFVPELMKPKFTSQHLLITEARKTRNKDSFTPEELLYMNEDIIVDQLMIKNAFEDTSGISIFKNPWHTIRNFLGIKSNKRRPRAQQSSVQESKRRRKDAKFKAAKTKIMKEEVELYRGRTNTQIVVTALIATVTFTVGFTMPGGYRDGDTGDADNGLAILSKRKAFYICMIADAVGLLFSVSSLFLFFISSLYQDPYEVSKFITASTGFNIVSVNAMMVTFITGTYVVLSHSPALAITVSVISCLFFLPVILLLIKLKNDPKEKFKL